LMWPTGSSCCDESARRNSPTSSPAKLPAPFSVRDPMERGSSLPGLGICRQSTVSNMDRPVERAASGIRPRSLVVAALLTATVSLGVPALSLGQTDAAMPDTEDTHYFDFWPGTWAEVVDGQPDTSATT